MIIITTPTEREREGGLTADVESDMIVIDIL